MSGDFEALSAAALDYLRGQLEQEAAFDVEEKGDGVIELEFEDGSKMVVNRHAAAREIWVAARSGGFHFRWDGAAWRDTRDGSELFAALSKLISAQSGVPVAVPPPPSRG
ncbi:MAG TPA: iron donor protein CyaY [Burkholderiales bacterium]|jgi:CyaY protein|nr:iron donor protein CyaY [Burkholderiales bacterium]